MFRRLFLTGLIFAAVVMMTRLVLADTIVWYGDYNGTDDAAARKDVLIQSSSNWNGSVMSTIVGQGCQGFCPQSGGPIGTIGWRSWQVGARCNYVFITWWDYGGRAAYNSSYLYDNSAQANIACSFTDKTGWSLGTHDFKHIGKPDWAPYVVHSANLPR